MTAVRTIQNVTVTPVTTEVPTLSYSDLVLIDDKVSDDSMQRHAIYQIAAGDADYPATLRFSIYRKPLANGGLGETTLTVKWDGYATSIDDTDDEVFVAERCTASFTFSVPGNNPVFDEAQLLALAGNLYSALFTGVDGSNIPTTVATGKLIYNIAAIH
jgi:hypothetical protein